MAVEDFNGHERVLDLAFDGDSELVLLLAEFLEDHGTFLIQKDKKRSRVKDLFPHLSQQ